MRLRFFVPADVESPTGGNVYDLRVAAALREGGHDIELFRVDPPGLGEAVKQPWNGPTLVDGLLISHQPEVAESGRVAVLVHMPLAWRPGMTPNQLAELTAVEGRTLRAAATTVATSAWTARFLDRCYQLSGVPVAAPGVDPALLVDGSDPPMLVQVAAIMPHKDQLIVVEALARLKDLRWQARLSGSTTRDPSYAAAVREHVTAHGLEGRIELAGEVDRDRAWAGADLALLPSRVESFGMVVTEGLARGIPAIVAEGGPAEALGRDPRGERPGVVVPPGDLDALTAQLRLWLTEPDHRDVMRRSAIARRDTLDGWEVTARCLHQALAATQ